MINRGVNGEYDSFYWMMATMTMAMMAMMMMLTRTMTMTTMSLIVCKGGGGGGGVGGAAVEAGGPTHEDITKLVITHFHDEDDDEN